MINKILLLIIESIILATVVVNFYREFLKEKPVFGDFYTFADALVGAMGYAILIGMIIFVFTITLYW